MQGRAVGGGGAAGRDRGGRGPRHRARGVRHGRLHLVVEHLLVERLLVVVVVGRVVVVVPGYAQRGEQPRTRGRAGARGRRRGRADGRGTRGRALLADEQTRRREPE